MTSHIVQLKQHLQETKIRLHSATPIFFEDEPPPFGAPSLMEIRHSAKALVNRSDFISLLLK